MIIADARHLPIATGVVQCCVTSPPYWGLRDYGTGRWVGGDLTCDHRRAGTRASAASTLRSDGREHVGPYVGERTLTVGYPYRDACGRCGAVRVDDQIGLEQSPERYIDQLVAVFREVHRVLRDDGVLWLNLGDSYANDGKWGGESNGKHDYLDEASRLRAGLERRVSGLKPKDMVGIPWRVAFALQADGWYLRSDVIWSKPNPMPESITDRPTKAHEYIFLLTKRARYFYDAEAIKEPTAGTAHPRGAGVNPKAGKNEASPDRRRAGFNERWKVKQNASFSAAVTEPVAARNKRTVWTVQPQPFAGAHFATFPEEIAATCILAGSRPGDVVLDPFLGSGTTARVALSLGRRAIGCDLQPKYLTLQRERMTVTLGLPLEMEATA